MPALVDRLEVRDRVVVGAVFEISGLNLVDPLQFLCCDCGFGGDHSGGLGRPHGDRMHQQTRRGQPGTGKSQRLPTAERGQFGARGPGVQSSLDVRVGLTVPQQNQPTAHRLPSRSSASHRSASSSRGGTVPAADAVGHEPR